MKKRVCAYARVSTNSRSQEHSFQFQSNYWNEKLSNDPEYEYVGLYADKGISGKDAARRPKFMQMVELARSKKVDIIFCKSVQRFARNTEDLLTYVREFRELDIAVIFEKENINTLTNGTDLYLSIAAAVAEDDLNRYSENIKWTMKDKFQKGEANVNGRCYGYQMEAGKEKFVIIEYEAEVVRRIFKMFLDGMSYEKIASTLNEEGIKSSYGKTWRFNTIRRFLSNEKYVGDCLSQKTYTVNGMDIRNKGERDMYYVENHHEGIIDRDTWNLAQEEIAKRENTKLKGGVLKAYPFTGLIRCGCCGRPFRHKVSNSLYTPKFDVWFCESTADKCTSIRIKDTELKRLFVEAYNEFVGGKHQTDEEQSIEKEIEELQKQAKELVRLHANGWINKSNFSEEYDRLTSEISRLNQKLDDYMTRFVGDSDFKPILIFSEDKVEKFLDGIVIIGTQVRFRFYNGVVVTKRITETRIYDKDKQKLKDLEDRYNENDIQGK